MRLFFLAIIVILLVGLVLLGLSDTPISIADTNIPNSEVASGANKASNSSVSATITITMTGILNE